MEFPDLGDHCHEDSCKRLDFLPMKCDECSNIFCKDHIQYSKHSCIHAYKKDVQVPVCPLCNQPVPSKRGETPDIAVSEHIDRDCTSDPAISKRKVYTNACSLKGCRQKELIPVTCTSCRKNYCLRHRHFTDHNCQSTSEDRRLSPAGAAAIGREQNTANKWISSKFSNVKNDIRNHFTPRPPPQPVSASSLQALMSEDEALAIALQKSLIENNADSHQPRSLQEREDLMLAEALAASERDATSQRRGTRGKDKNCSIS